MRSSKKLVHETSPATNMKKDGAQTSGLTPPSGALKAVVWQTIASSASENNRRTGVLGAQATPPGRGSASRCDEEVGSTQAE